MKTSKYLQLIKDLEDAEKDVKIVRREFKLSETDLKDERKIRRDAEKDLLESNNKKEEYRIKCQELTEELERANLRYKSYATKVKDNSVSARIKWLNSYPDE